MKSISKLPLGFLLAKHPSDQALFAYKLYRHPVEWGCINIRRLLNKSKCNSKHQGSDLSPAGFLQSPNKKYFPLHLRDQRILSVFPSE